MSKSIATFALLGLALLLASFALPPMVRGTWSERNAEELAHSAATLHQLAHAHGDKGHEEPSHASGKSEAAPGANDAALEAARQDYARRDQGLQQVQTGGQTTARVMRWAGIACLLAAIGRWWLGRAKDD